MGIPSYDWELHRYLSDMLERRGNQRPFYQSAAWRRLRARVLEEFHCESQDELTQSPARYVRAQCVHHVMHVDEHPGWALSEFYVDDAGVVRRNLVPLSHDAHDARHGRMRFSRKEPVAPLTSERW